MSFYAVRKGTNIGVFDTWEQCKKSVDGYKGAVFKKFKSKKSAENFISKDDSKILENFKIDIEVYTDGACSNNGYENAKAGIGVFFGEDDSRNLSKAVVGRQTNNVAELTAIIEACNILENEIKENKNICIYSDSKISIGWCTTTGEKYAAKNWKGKIPNVELIKKAYSLIKNKDNILLMHVKAHTGNTDKHSVGNDGADKLANEAIGLVDCPYNLSSKKLNSFPVYYESKEEFICLLFKSELDKNKISKIINISEEDVENIL